MKVIKYMLLLGVAVGLSACETLGDSFDQDQYVAPSAASRALSADPRFYMDDSNPNMQKMLSSFDRTP